MYWVVGVGLLYSLVFLGWAIGRGRRRPRHPVPWIIAIALLGLDVVAHAAMGVGAMVESPLQGGWVAVGTVAIAALLVTAALQPQLAGWAFVGSAVLMPLVLLTVSVWPGVDTGELAPLPVLLALWSTRALIVAVLLIGSEGRPWWIQARTPTDPSSEASARAAGRGVA